MEGVVVSKERSMNCIGSEGGKRGDGLRTSSSHEEEEAHRVEQVAHAERLSAGGSPVAFICSDRRHNA
jgi:hypothetical protein